MIAPEFQPCVVCGDLTRHRKADDPLCSWCAQLPAPTFIRGAPDNPYIYLAVTYDYAKDRSHCPGCGGLGIPWNGWFCCENPNCGLVAVVDDGRCFRPGRLLSREVVD